MFPMPSSNKYITCTACFLDQGLRLNAHTIGIEASGKCVCCGNESGLKLTKELLLHLAYQFFVRGSFHRTDYGGAPIVQFNDKQKGGQVNFEYPLSVDAELIEKVCGIGFYYYGPRLWMVGEIDPLNELQDRKTGKTIIGRIVKEYPAATLEPEQLFYRVRKAPNKPEDQSEYDSPPLGVSGNGRLDAGNFKVLYGSPDLELCVHECRFTAEDELYVATLSAATPLRLLNLADVLNEEVTEFESLDISVHMLFFAGNHSYEIAREIAKEALTQGYDGIVYPSYFSELRLGIMPLRTSYGLSHRIVSQLHDDENALSIPNYAIFGRPIEKAKLNVRCINKMVISRVGYDFHFGPAKT